MHTIRTVMKSIFLKYRNHYCATYRLLTTQKNVPTDFKLDLRGIVLIFPENRLHNGSNGMHNVFSTINTSHEISIFKKSIVAGKHSPITKIKFTQNQDSQSYKKAATQGSNQGPLDLQFNALATELSDHHSCNFYPILC